MGRRDGLFYGWVIVAVMGTVGALTMALGGLNFGLFIKPIGDDLGIGRATFGWAQSARQIASAATAPTVGGLIDRFGARILLTTAALTTGLALIGLAAVTDGWQIVLLFALMGVVGMSGPGALVTTVPVTKWFVRRRATALSFMSLGVPVGGLLFVPLTQILIDALGWRRAWIVLALVGAGLIVPLALAFVRREPEDMGLRPDGDPTDPSPTGLGATALDAAASGISTFAMGLLIRHVPARFIGAGGFLMLTFASWLTIVTDTNALLFLSMISFGLGIGVLMLMQNYLWAEYFGRVHLGAIRGAVMPITLAAGGAGAPIAGYVRDVMGSYDGVWLAATGLMALGALVIAITPPPRQLPSQQPVVVGP